MLPARPRGLLAACVFLTLGMGCRARGGLPTYPLADPQTTRLRVAEQLGRVRTLSGDAAVELRGADGQTVRLDAAIAAQLPDRVRLRAWKFGRAVFDLTLTPDGAWLVEPDRRPADQQPVPDAFRGDHARQVWGLMSGSLFRDPAAAAATSPDPGTDAHVTVLTYPDGRRLVGRVHRPTLTPVTYTMLDADHRPVFELRLTDHAQFPGGIVWPRTIEATSRSGTTRIELRQAEFNTDVPPEAFIPPPRARPVP